VGIGTKHASHAALWIAVSLVLGVALFMGSLRGRQLIGLETTRGDGDQSTRHHAKISVLPGVPSIGIHKLSLYGANDPWKSYLANEQTCPGGERTDLPLPQQADVMLCLIDWARQRHGLSPLPATSLLDSTAIEKANEIVRCHNFSHTACGQVPDADVRAVGYRGAFGENLYIAGGRYGSPRVALDGWLNSPGHRENLFRPQWRAQGIAVLKLDRFGPYHKMTLWVSHFGSE